jgi:hypothetical protein
VHHNLFVPRDCLSLAFEVPGIQLQGCNEANSHIHDDNFVATTGSADCGTTMLTSTQARIHRLENVGMPAIARTGCMPPWQTQIIFILQITLLI